MQDFMYNYVFFPCFPKWLGTYDFILKFILVLGPQPPQGTLQGDLKQAPKCKRESLAQLSSIYHHCWWNKI